MNKIYDLEQQIEEYKSKIEDLKRELQRELQREHYEIKPLFGKTKVKEELINKLTKEEYKVATW